jgi:hypothetical protein
MAITYEPIATATLGTATASVTFSTISGSYTDLVLVIQRRYGYSNKWYATSIRFNSDTGSNYSSRASMVAEPQHQVLIEAVVKPGSTHKSIRDTLNATQITSNELFKHNNL